VSVEPSALGAKRSSRRASRLSGTPTLSNVPELILVVVTTRLRPSMRPTEKPSGDAGGEVGALRRWIVRT
jgi:hypothetical protein